MKTTTGEGQIVSDQQAETKRSSDVGKNPYYVSSPNKPQTPPKNPNYQHLSATRQKPSPYQKAIPRQKKSKQKEPVTTEDIYEEIEQ